MKLATLILQLLAGFFSWLGNKQLIDSGRAEAERDVLQRGRKNESEVDKIVADIDNMSDDDFSKRVSKWRKD